LRVYYRLGAVGEKKVFEDYSTKYYGVAIAANLAAFYPDWLPTFQQTLGKPYFIDPVTYAFARNLNGIIRDLEVKKSFQILARAYSRRVSELIERDKRQLNSKDFLTDCWNTELIEELAGNVIDFQKRITQPPSQQTLVDYAKILGEEIEERSKGPDFLLAPYFYFSSLSDPWYQISLRVAKQSLNRKGATPLYAVICTSKELLLDKPALQRVREDYEEFDGYVIWVSGFNEKEEGEEYLQGFVKLVEALSERSKPVYNLYGEYFSAVTSKFGLSGYSRGICYSGSRSVDAAPGARILKLYYLELNHGKVSETVARTFFTYNPDELCGCEVCSSILQELPSKEHTEKVSYLFDKMDLTRIRGHFLTTHFKEQEEISRVDLAEIIKRLNASFNKCKRLNAQLYNIPYTHLLKWSNVLSNKSKN